MSGGEGERRRRGSFRKGNVVSPQQASDQSAMQNVFEFLHDYVPQAVGGVSKEEGRGRERVLWARFETGDINDRSMEHLPPSSDSAPPLLLTLGTAAGFSMWKISPGGEAVEVYASVSEGDPARIVRLLKTPEAAPNVSQDKFPNLRPIIAVVRKGRHAPSSGGPVGYSTLQMVSLRSPAGENLVRKIVFRGRPVMDIHCNRRVVVVVFQKRLVVLDAGSLDNKFVIKNDYPSGGFPCNPVALGTRWLAFSETKWSSKHQSIGGMSHVTPASVATTVLKNVKKGITALTETIQGLAGKTQQSAAVDSADTQRHMQPSGDTANIVTVVDVCGEFPQEVKVQDLEAQCGVVAHFLAHSEQDEHIAALHFNPSGTLLLTASSEGHNFHLFNILPHPTLSAESAVHHLYTLYRGATSGVVQDVCFSTDSRWVVVSTLNGTSHVFPVSPYGGAITLRTHTPARVVNRLSRFHTSAGMESFPSLSPPSSKPHPPSPPGTADLSREFPSVPSWSNPRSLPLPSPVTVSPLQQIKQPYLSPAEQASERIPPRSHDNGDPFVTLAGPDSICVAAIFSSHSENRTTDSTEQTASYSLFVVGSNGMLIDHLLEPAKLSAALEGDDAPIELLHRSQLCWRLLSVSAAGSMGLPLSEDNPLIKANNDYHSCTLQNKRTPVEQQPAATEGEWLSQVEILTHAPPSRRLWMGPQFSFKTYTAGASPSLPALTTSDVSSPTTTAVLLPSPSTESPLVDFLSDPTEAQSVVLKSLDTSPSLPMPTALGRDADSAPPANSSLSDTGVLEVFGSWSKVAPHLEGGGLENEVARQLDDAMKDSPVTVVTSDSVARTGFSPPHVQ